MISQVNAVLLKGDICSLLTSAPLFPPPFLFCGEKKMQQAGRNMGLIQWDTPNNKNTLLAVAGGMTHFNCACTNLSHSKKCCSYTQHFLQLSGALCGSGRSGGSAILFLWVSAGLTEMFPP